MKIFVITIALLLFTVGTSLGQKEISTFEHCSNSFVTVSLANLIQFSEMDIRELEEVAFNNGFRRLDDEDGIVIYVKGTVGEISQSISKSLERGWIFRSMLTPPIRA